MIQLSNGSSHGSIVWFLAPGSCPRARELTSTEGMLPLNDFPSKDAIHHDETYNGNNSRKPLGYT